MLLLLFYNDTSTTEVYTYGHTLSLHDALPICTDTSRAWYKLNDVRNNANSGWVSISSVLDNPGANAVQMADLIGADGYTGRAGALRVRNNNRVYQTTGVQSVLTAGFTTGGIGHSIELSARYHKDAEDRFKRSEERRVGKECG